MAIKPSFNVDSSLEGAYEKTDFTFTVKASTKGGSVYSPAGFSEVEYVIVQNGKPVVTCSLGEGITIADDGLLVQVGSDDMPIAGNYMHRLSVHNTAGKELPPIFQAPLSVHKKI